jgi:putative ABC transport system permease protein
MIAVALKGLAARKVRALLTAFAIVIGVSMVSGTFVLTDTMQKAFDGIFGATYDKTDAVISGKQVVASSTSGTVEVPAALLAKVRAVPEVGEAGGTIGGDDSVEVEILGHDGKAVRSGGAPALGIGYDAAHPRFNPMKLQSGAWPTGPGQVVIDAGTADKEHYGAGDTVKVSALGSTAPYRVTGVATYGEVDSLGGATIAVFEQKTAQAVMHKQGVFDGISIAAKDGTSPAQLVKAVEPIVPRGLEVKDGEAQAAADAADTTDGLDFIRYFLLGFGGIALFVGAFVIFNTLSITVAQRTREYATLRTLGASRRQVMRSVVVEALVIGLVASLLGLLLGIGIAKGMNALFKALGTDLPDAGTVIETRTIVVSMLLGTIITLVASVVPARRATRVPPIAAVREGAVLPASRLAKHSATLAAVVIAGAVAAISVGVFANGLGTLGVVVLLGGGIVALFLGVAFAAPHLVRPLTRVISWPARRGGVAGELAGANAVRSPARTASTAAALMVGLTLVTVVAVLGAGLKSTVKSAVSDQVDAAYVAEGKDGERFAAAEGDALAGVSGVRAASQVRDDNARVNGNDEIVTGVDPQIVRFYRFDWTDGSDRTAATLGPHGALVTKRYADDHDVAIGSRLAMLTPSGARRAYVVRGIYDPPAIDEMLGSVAISRGAFDRSFPRPKNQFTFIDAPPSSDRALTATARGFGDATFNTGEGFVRDYTDNFSSFLAMLYVLLAFSVVVSLFGMVNTLVLSVFERTREIGLMRTIGMTRRQLRRMVRHESVITALIGAAMGLPLGVFLAGLVTQALSKYDVALALPLGELAVFTAIAVGAGIAAAVLPARRASRLNVLDALHYE